MSDRVKWIDYKGYQISYRDFSGLAGQAYMLAMDDAIEQLNGLESGSLLLTLTDVTNTHTTKELTGKQKELQAACNRFIPIYSVVGVTGIMKILAKAFKASFFFANSMEEAKDYLVEQAKNAEQKQPVA